MKVVVLDAYTLNPGDLSWKALEQFGDIVLYDRTPGELIFERSQGADILLTNKTPLNAATIERLPTLKYIGVLATGYNVIDIDAARKCGIIISNVPGYGITSVAQHTFALLLELCHHTRQHSDLVMKNQWSNSPDFCFWHFPLTELAGKTMGILGLGNIGSKVAEIASAFGMKIVASGRQHTNQKFNTPFKWADFESLLKESDVVSLHCPLTPETNGLINKACLGIMKRSAFLLNTSRGQIINESDLMDALNNEVIAGAGLDVLSTEPPNKNNPLFSAKNCIITPHIAWATKEARQRLMAMAIENLSAYIDGKPQNMV
jgi:glycerate dehydrogenase